MNLIANQQDIGRERLGILQQINEIMASIQHITKENLLLLKDLLEP